MRWLYWLKKIAYRFYYKIEDIRTYLETGCTVFRISFGDDYTYHSYAFSDNTAEEVAQEFANDMRRVIDSEILLQAIEDIKSGDYTHE